MFKRSKFIGFICFTFILEPCEHLYQGLGLKHTWPQRSSSCNQWTQVTCAQRIKWSGTWAQPCPNKVLSCSVVVLSVHPFHLPSSRADVATQKLASGLLLTSQKLLKTSTIIFFVTDNSKPTKCISLTERCYKCERRQARKRWGGATIVRGSETILPNEKTWLM